MKAILVLLLAALLLASCAPLEITDTAIAHGDGIDEYVVSWQTTEEAQCKISYCRDGLCYTSPVEFEFHRSHHFRIPSRDQITITAVDRLGRAATFSLPAR